MPTKIGWCDETFNPWWGCERVSPACAHCYADTWAKRVGMSDLWVKGGEHAFRFFGDKHWDDPLRWARRLPAELGRRPRVFCASMADVFEEHPDLEEPRRRLFDLIEQTPELDWLLLTKRPEAARDMLRPGGEIYWGDSRILPNVWLGVSIENARYSYRADVLRSIPAAVRFISAEPLLGSLFPPAVTHGRHCPCSACEREDWPSITSPCGMHGPSCPAVYRKILTRPLDLTSIDWLIIGGESGPRSRSFSLEHARELQRAAWSMRFHERPAIFVKQLGAKPTIDDLEWGLIHKVVGQDAPPYTVKLRDRKGEDWEEWPADLRVREFPRSAVAA